MKGWIKIHRKIKNNVFYTNSNAVHCWLECLLRATHDDTEVLSKREIVKLKQGQFLMGRKEFGESIGVNESTVWFWILKFEKTGMLNLEKTHKGSIVTIKNWKDYQVESVETKKTKKFSAPSLKEVEDYFEEKGYLLKIARKAWNYYEANDWKDSRGKKIKSWKQKMIGVWFTDDNKSKTKNYGKRYN